MARLIPLLFLVLTSSLSAQYTYIVPVMATRIDGSDGTYRSRTDLINVGSSSVHVTARSFATEPLSPPCLFGAYVDAWKQSRLGGDPNLTEHCAGKLLTVVIDSAQPLEVRSRVESIRTTSSGSSQNFQEIPVATSWLPADRDVVIPEFDSDNVSARANLFLTNPNEFPISVSLTLRRGFASKSETIQLPPESMRLYPVEHLTELPPCGVNPCPTTYGALLRSTGEFLAGISTAYPGGGEWFVAALPLPAPPVVLQPACAQPAPLLGKWNVDAPGYLVMLQPGLDAAEVAARLGAKYGFSATAVWTVVSGFAAELTPEALAGLRCESEVLRVEYNATGGISKISADYPTALP